MIIQNKTEKLNENSKNVLRSRAIQIMKEIQILLLKYYLNTHPNRNKQLCRLKYS